MHGVALQKVLLKLVEMNFATEYTIPTSLLSKERTEVISIVSGFPPFAKSAHQSIVKILRRRARQARAE